MQCFYRSKESIWYSESYNFAKKLKYYGVRGIKNRLLITHGVPQGSVLGLFISTLPILTTYTKQW